MIEKELVEKLVKEKIRGTDLYLVEVVVNSTNHIQVLVDSFEGVSIDTCVEISRFLNEKMDRDAEDYSLEVSSPGLGSPFRVRQQFDKNMGRVVEVLLFNGLKKKGKLLKVDDHGLTLEVTEKVPSGGSGKKKVKKSVEIELDFSEIKTTKAVISFN
jgi:ribosome maturation factor RimP